MLDLLILTRNAVSDPDQFDKSSHSANSAVFQSLPVLEDFRPHSRRSVQGKRYLLENATFVKPLQSTFRHNEENGVYDCAATSCDWTKEVANMYIAGYLIQVRLDSCLLKSV